MRASRFLSFGILATLLASSAVLYAQDEKQQEERPRQAEPNRQAPPESRRDDMKPRQQEEAKPARPEERQPRQEEAQPRGEMRQGQQEPSRQENRQEMDRREAGRQDQGQQRAHGRPEGRSAHIPDDRFRAQFGRSHKFVAQRPVVVGGQSQFVYGGYTFVLVDAWPPDWAYTDDCYIDYTDGDYYLYDLNHPGFRIALFVVM